MHKRLFPALMVAVPAFAPAILAQSVPSPVLPKVTVHHVEAPESKESPAYAAVNFGPPQPSAPTTRRSIPAKPLPQEAPFANIEFIGLGESGRTFSNHAAAVGSVIYGPSSPATGLVGTVYAQSAFPWLQTLRPTRIAVPLSPPPEPFPAGVVVSNHSWVNSIGNDHVNGEIIRRADFAAARDNVVLAAGAVCGGPFNAIPLMWSCSNAIAAAGDDPQTPFDPASARVGKKRADVWWPGKASYATAQASSTIAMLASIARSTQTNTTSPDAFHDATRAVVLRSILLTGCDKTGHFRDPVPYPRELPNHLRRITGAGRINAANSRAILSAPAIAPARTSPAGILLGTPQLTPRGWSRLVLQPTGANTPDTRHILFELTEDAPTFQATATTNVTQLQRKNGDLLLLDSRAESRILPAISMQLRRVIVTDGGLTLAPASDNPHLTSAAPEDNVQHIFLDTPLSKGRYALVITGDPKYPCEVGVSFDAREPAKLPPPAPSAPQPTQVAPAR